MPATLNLNINQIKKLITQLSPDEKEDLYEEIKKDEAKEILQYLQSSGNKMNITMDEITTEVEFVREQMYHEGHL